MKRETRQRMKKISLNVLSLSLLLVLIVPVCAVLAKGLGIIFVQTTISLAVIGAYIVSYGVSIFTTYKVAKVVFNYLKDEFIIGHKSIKRKMKNLCKTVDMLDKTEDFYKAEYIINDVEKLIKDEKNIITKADETIELLSKLSKNNVLELLFAEEKKDEIIKYMVQLQNLKQVYKEKVKRFEEIKKEIREKNTKNLEKDLKGRVEKDKDIKLENRKEVLEKEIIKDDKSIIKKKEAIQCEKQNNVLFPIYFPVKYIFLVNN